MDDTLEPLFKSILEPRGKKAVAILTPSSAVEVDVMLLKRILPTMRGIIVCMDRAPSSYTAMFEEQGIDTSLISYLDVTGSGEKGESIATAGDICDLTNLGISLFKLVASLKPSRQHTFVLFDAVASMQWYNGIETVGRFLHTSNLRFRDLDVFQIFVLDTKSNIKSEVMKFCDDIVEIENVIKNEFVLAKK